MKRFVTGILTGIMLISSLSVSASAELSDVQGHWGIEWDVIATASYNKMLDNGIEGKYDGEISPDKQLIWRDAIGDWVYLYCNPQFVK